MARSKGKRYMCSTIDQAHKKRDTLQADIEDLTQQRADISTYLNDLRRALNTRAAGVPAADDAEPEETAVEEGGQLGANQPDPSPSVDPAAQADDLADPGQDAEGAAARSEERRVG